MDKFKSKLIFKEYKVKEVEFKLNEEYDGKGVKIDIDIDKSIEYIGKNMNVVLSVKLFNKAERNYPFTMNVVVKGIFEVENNTENINYEANAIAILYPYIRAIISTYTSAANTQPLILPPINVNKLIEDQQSKGNNKEGVLN